MFCGRLFSVLLAAMALPAAIAEPLTLAVASNFARPAHELAARFEVETGRSVRVTTGSTGKLFAQISNGAPFDVLLAADSERPRRLEDSGDGVRDTRFTYATGSLVLWSRDPDLGSGGCLQALEQLGDRKLAIANPLTAPYGAAARQFLESVDLWEPVQPNLVFGENIAQALQFVASGNASLGLIANVQAVDQRLPEAVCRWQVPASSHAPIEQQAILLARAAQNDVARAFLDFIKGPAAIEIIRSHGYQVQE